MGGEGRKGDVVVGSTGDLVRIGFLVLVSCQQVPARCASGAGLDWWFLSAGSEETVAEERSDVGLGVH